jgi:hypothetical protein
MRHIGRTSRSPRTFAGLFLALAATLLLACGDDEGSDGTTIAFDPAAGLEPVVQCLTDEGWAETGSLSSGSAYTVMADSGAAVLLSTNEAGVEPLADGTTFTVPASDPEDGSLEVENITGTISNDERTQIEDCAGG